MHYTDNDYSNAVINGLKDTFDKMGIEVIAVTDAQIKIQTATQEAINRSPWWKRLKRNKQYSNI